MDQFVGSGISFILVKKERRRTCLLVTLLFKLTKLYSFMFAILQQTGYRTGLVSFY